MEECSKFERVMRRERGARFGAPPAGLNPERRAGFGIALASEC